ncbi:DUF397 domain-containing protein [Streptomyces sp. NPDC003435]
MSENLSTLNWFKSSHSDGPDGNSCVEAARAPDTIHVRDSKCATGPQLALPHSSWQTFVDQAAGLAWSKSSHSGGNDGNSCVEVASAPRTIRVRDSKHAATGPRLTFAHDSWAAFITVAREGL